MITPAQQRYYRKCTRILAKVTDTDPDGMHEVIKQCLEVKTVYRMAPANFKDFTEQLYCWAVEKFGIKLPDANKKKMKETILTVNFKAVCEVCDHEEDVVADTFEVDDEKKFVFRFPAKTCTRCGGCELTPVLHESTEVK